MKKLTFSLLLGLLLSVLAPALAQDDDLQCNAFRSSPDDQRRSYYMGEGAAYLQSGNYSSAILSYRCVTEQIDPSYRDAWLNQAAAESAVRDYEAAIELYNQAVSLDGDFAPAYNNRAIVHAARGDFDLALADLDRALEQDSGYAEAYINRGVVQAAEGNYDAAFADFDEAIALGDLEDVLSTLRDPDRASDAPRPQFNADVARAYALRGIVHSRLALEEYNNYLALRGIRSDARIQSAAGALESRFNFELRFDDGSWLLMADFVQ
jgi:tetratricopeptide (TPR) repeat protein